MTSPFVTLYSSWRSSSSYRVRIGLNWKKISFTCRAVHLVRDGGLRLQDDYAAINPMREVPTLLIHGHTLTQSTGARWAVCVPDQYVYAHLWILQLFSSTSKRRTLTARCCRARTPIFAAL